MYHLYFIFSYSNSLILVLEQHMAFFWKLQGRSTPLFSKVTKKNDRRFDDHYLVAGGGLATARSA
jgi:hypothetical protein